MKCLICIAYLNEIVMQSCDLYYTKFTLNVFFIFFSFELSTHNLITRRVSSGIRFSSISVLNIKKELYTYNVPTLTVKPSLFFYIFKLSYELNAYWQICHFSKFYTLWYSFTTHSWYLSSYTINTGEAFTGCWGLIPKDM